MGSYAENVDEDRVSELIEENNLVNLLLVILHRDKVTSPPSLRFLLFFSLVGLGSTVLQ